MRTSLTLTLLSLLLTLLSLPAQAKVVFTGYADLRYNAGTKTRISADAASLAAFGASDTTGELTRGFSASGLGLFAATQVREELQFLMDLSFVGVGQNVTSTRIQYAYLDWTPRPETTVRGGRITLPFGYFNEDRFYAFQRYTIIAPVFQSAILGLPIADWGASASHRIPLKAFNLEVTAYTVNGYGAASTSRTSLRAPSVPGGLSLSSNLRSTDSDHNPALGGRFRLTDIGGAKVETGVSYYWGTWDTSGLEPMSMADAHLHAYLGGFDFLVETLRLSVRGDRGFAPAIGHANWMTTGGFATLSYDRLPVLGGRLVPYGQYEHYRTKPRSGDAREMLRTTAGGLACKLSENFLLKGEYFWLGYDVPSVSTGGRVRLAAEGVLLSAVVTF